MAGSERKLLRGGIVGCGIVVETTHMPAWCHTSDVEIIALCDINKEIAAKMAARWKIPEIYDSFANMLTAEKLDFIDICTPPQTHHKLAMQAIDAGLHVLVEKPMAIDLAQADEMVSAAKNHNVKLCPVHNNLFSPVIQKATSMINEGKIGHLLSVDINMLESASRIGHENHWAYSLPGGIFCELAPHAVYLLMEFLGEIKSVLSVNRKYCDHPGLEASALKVLVECKKGLGSFTILYNTYRNILELNFLGTKGTIYINNQLQIIIHRKTRTESIHDLLFDRLDLAWPVLTAGVSGIASRIQRQKRVRIGHKVIAEKFAESLRNNTDPPVSGEQGRETTRILDKIWEQID